MKNYDTIVYLDSSIRFSSANLEPLVKTVSITGLLTQYIGLNLTCYTNPKMFEWFGDSVETYIHMHTIEANLLVMHKNFINSLFMKAWVTCAFEENCIAPVGSRISPCCGCHRFDQDALTIIMSHFYGHPYDIDRHLPLYSLTKDESYFFSVRRYEGKNYFD